jgi:hypothetical protein
MDTSRLPSENRIIRVNRDRLAEWPRETEGGQRKWIMARPWKSGA